MSFLIDNVPRVIPFTVPHLGYIAFFLVATILFFMNLKKIKNRPDPLFNVLKWINTITVIVFYTWSLLFTDSFILTGLPLHVCRIVSIVGLYYYWTKDKRVEALLFYTGAFGLVAVMYPANVHPLYTHLIGYVSQVTHVLIIVTWYYVVFIRGFRPTRKDFTQTALFFLVVLLLVWPFNYMIGGGEYFYIRQARPFFLDWPDIAWILFTYGLTLFVMSIKYLSLASVKKRAHASNPSNTALSK